MLIILAQISIINYLLKGFLVLTSFNHGKTYYGHTYKPNCTMKGSTVVQVVSVPSQLFYKDSVMNVAIKTTVNNIH